MQVPSIMGLDLTRKRNDMWWGGYYLTGEQHSYRRDKMKVAIYNGDIWVHEEGIAVVGYLVNNGRADYRDIASWIARASHWMCKVLLRNARSWRVMCRGRWWMLWGSCVSVPLFRWMCTFVPRR